MFFAGKGGALIRTGALIRANKIELKENSTIPTLHETLKFLKCCKGRGGATIRIGALIRMKMCSL